MPPNPTSVEVLTALRSGEVGSLDTLVPALYQELRLIAHRHLARRRGCFPGAATTSLVNEVYLKLVDQTQAEWRDRAHFLAVADDSYCTPPTVKRTFHGDQWVTLEIDVNNGLITHYINGERILSYSNPTYDPKNEIAKTMIADGNTSVTGGYISLQSNSHPIDFRKIELLTY
jgi:hypothetical protein